MNIKIELGDFFEDYRKQILLFIDIDEKPLVSEVIKYICEVCEIELRDPLNESLYLVANGIYIPEKQPSQVLKDVKNVLSLKRRLNTGGSSEVSNKSESYKLLNNISTRIHYEKKFEDQCGQDKNAARSTFSINDLNIIDKSIPVTENDNDLLRQNESFILESEINELECSSSQTNLNFSKLSRKEKRKKEKKKIYNDLNVLQDAKKKNSVISFNGKTTSDDNLCFKPITEIVSPQENEHELFSNCKFSLSSNHDINVFLEDPNATKSTKKKKKVKNKENYNSGDIIENCVTPSLRTLNSTNNCRDTDIGSIEENKCLPNKSYFDKNADVKNDDKLDICPRKQKKNIEDQHQNEHLENMNDDHFHFISLSTHSSFTSSVDRSKCNKDSKMELEEKELVEEKLPDAENNDGSKEYNNDLLNLNFELNPQKTKRKRKHKKKSRHIQCKEFSDQNNQAIREDYFEPIKKMLKTIDNSDKNKYLGQHIKFSSDDDESKYVDSNKTIIDMPFSEFQEAIAFAGNSSQQEDPNLINNLFCRNVINSPSSTVVRVHSLVPSVSHYCGKEPPSSIPSIDKSFNTLHFAPLLKLENSPEVCVFERRNLKVNSKDGIIQTYSSLKEPVQINNLPHGPPSPKIFETNINKDEISVLHQCEELEKLTYPHTYYRKKKVIPVNVNGIADTINKEITNEHILNNESFLGLPFSFISGSSKGERKVSPILKSGLAAKELVSNSNTNMQYNNNDSSSLNDITCEDENFISYMGAKPKKVKKKKMFSPLGTLIKSLKHSYQNVISTDESETVAIRHINPNNNNDNNEIVIVEPNFKDGPHDKEYSNNNNKTNSNEQIRNRIIDNTATSIGTNKCETINSSSNVDRSLSVGKSEKKENKNLNYFYKSCPILHTLPNVGDIIAAKVMTLDETYSPCFSDYRPSKVNSLSGLILSLQFLDCSEVTPDELRKDKFAVIDKNLKVSNIDWRDLQDVRLLFP